MHERKQPSLESKQRTCDPPRGRTGILGATGSAGSVDDFKLSWEDLPAGGDKDYNDTVIAVQITPDDLLV